MGADAHIDIWRDNIVRAAFTDCDELFDRLPMHYVDHLSGIKYHHCYVGDNFYTRYDDPDDWSLPHYRQWKGIEREPLTPDQEEENNRVKARLQEFVNWLQLHATQWEVWT